jgi:UDP-N-acetylmuramoyl-tripeptide--D-alanyl-D-alanine ligase
LDKPKKIIIIGDMFELGAESFEEHKAIVNFLNNNSNFECHFVGKDFFANRIQNEHFHFYNTFEDFTQYLSSVKLENKTLLIKGSRGMALERTLEYL